MIGVYISLIFSENNTLDIFFIKNIDLEKFGFITKNNYSFLGFFLILIFVIKFILIIWINNSILKFSLSRVTEVRKLLVDSYSQLDYSEFTQRDTSEYITTMGDYVANYGSTISNLLKILSEGLVFILIFSLFF